MKRKILFLTPLILISVIIYSSLSAQDRKEAIDEMLNLAQKQESPSASNNKTETKIDPDDQSIPDWLKRTSFGINIESDQTPRIYLETVQPLYQSLDKLDTFFTHERISIQHERGTYAVGFGYRRLMCDENLLAGINTFFDYKDLHRHYREGLGLEVMGETFEARLNSYFRLSPKRKIEETTTSSTYERVANGFDLEAGAPLPYLPWFKIFGSFYHYNFRNSKDMNGWKLRGELKPFKFLTLNLETYDDNKGEQEYRLDSRFSLAFDGFLPRSILSAFKLAKEPYPAVDLKEHTLDRVERNFNVQLEKWIESAGMSINIGRGT